MKASIVVLFVYFSYLVDTSQVQVSAEHNLKYRVKRQSNTCSSSEFKCNSGECIPTYSLCDGSKDCQDGSDETKECWKTECPAFAFRCSYGACVDGDAECNGKEECADGSDENTARCPKTQILKTCGEKKFTCQNGDCIDQYSLCDGVADCSDSSDETFTSCSKFRCAPFAYQCAYGACVDGNGKCNNITDCADGSDELAELCGRPSSVTIRPFTTTTLKPGVTGCRLPNQPPFGKYIISGQVDLAAGTVVFDGTYLTYQCNANYALLPNIPIIICANNQWSTTFPACIKTCPPRVSTSVDIKCEYDGVEVDCTKKMYDGTLATMKCKTHYEVVDITYRNNLIKCHDGSWDYDILRCVPGCGKLIPKGGQLFVVGGQSAGIGDFPWHVGIYRKKTLQITNPNTEIEHICGGSIINPKVILSAAHCFADETNGKKLPAENYLVAAGKYYRDYNDVRDKAVQKSEVHLLVLSKEYRALQSSYTHDIALVIIKDAFTISNLVQPVCIDWTNDFESEQLRENNYGMVAGWGLTAEGASKGAESLKELRVPFVDKDTCFLTVPPDFTTYITVDKICAGWTNGSSVCQGDSGGGLVFVKKDINKYFLRGIVSNGPVKEDSCDSHQVGLYTQVSYHLDLIRRTEIEHRPN